MWRFPRGLFTEVALLEKESASMRQNTDSRRRCPAGLAFVCRCSKCSVRWQLILFSPSVNMSWQPLLYILSSASSRGSSTSRKPSFLEEKVVWLFGHKEQLLFFPALTPVLKPASQLSCWSNCRYPSDAVTCAWLYMGLQAAELRCPLLAKVTKHGRHRGPWV